VYIEHREEKQTTINYLLPTNTLLGDWSIINNWRLWGQDRCFHHGSHLRHCWALPVPVAIWKGKGRYSEQALDLVSITMHVKCRKPLKPGIQCSVVVHRIARRTGEQCVNKKSTRKVNTIVTVQRQRGNKNERISLLLTEIS